MIAFSTGPTAVERLMQWVPHGKNGSSRKHTTHTNGNIDTVKELVLSQKDASGILSIKQ